MLELAGRDLNIIVRRQRTLAEAETRCVILARCAGFWAAPFRSPQPTSTSPRLAMFRLDAMLDALCRLPLPWLLLGDLDITPDIVVPCLHKRDLAGMSEILIFPARCPDRTIRLHRHDRSDHRQHNSCPDLVGDIWLLSPTLFVRNHS